MTGSAGFVGSHLVDRLLAEGHDVVGIDCFTDFYGRRTKEQNLADAFRSPNFTFAEADLRTDPLEPLLAGADAVVNEAATPGLILSWDQFGRYQENNLGVVERLAAASIAVGVDHFVQASTSSVYGAEATGTENSPTSPISPYGVTKLAAEHLLHAYRQSFGLPLTVLRYFSIYGPRQRPDMAFQIFCNTMWRGDPLTIYGDGLQSRSNTYIDDCITATVAALGRPPDGSTYNIGGGQEIQLLEAVRLLSEHLNVTPTIKHQAPRPGDQRRTRADTRQATADLGWTAQVKPEEGLARQADWAIDHINAQ